MTEKTYDIQCGCGQIKVTMTGDPRVRGFCHCGDCRELLNIPYHSVNAWENSQVRITAGQDRVNEYQHPRLRMKRFFCDQCGDTLFNSNAMDWRVFSQHLIKKSLGGRLPEELQSKSHFFYGQRIIDVGDDLPKRD